MRIAVWGTDHTLCDLPTREKWIRNIQSILHKTSLPYPFSYILLMTCNRCEIFFSSSQISHTATYLKMKFYEAIEDMSERQSYLYFAKDCFSHLSHLCSGLLSAQIGETDIRRQIKGAYENAKSIRPLSSELHFLFQKSLKISKQFIGSVEGQSTLQKVVSDLCCKIGRKGKIFFLGNSQTNRRLIRYFTQKFDFELWLCSRYAGDLWKNSDAGQIKRVDDSQMDLWTQCEIVICASSRDSYVIQKPKEKTSTQLIIDLSVPRCVHPDLEKRYAIPIIDIGHINEYLKKDPFNQDEKIRGVKREISSSAERAMSCFERGRRQKIHFYTEKARRTI